jgi:nicotinamidase-related amidase
MPCPVLRAKSYQMPTINFDSSHCIVLVIDLQPKFLAAIHEVDRVLDRSKFLCQVAALMEVPVLGSEQYPERMGGTDSTLTDYVVDPVRKMEFSAMNNPAFIAKLEKTGRKQAIVVGIETHICVSQTCLGLLHAGYQVAVCPDATSARTQDRHKLGMERLRDAGVVPVHTEALSYEWMRSADDPRFRSMLEIVKSAQF